MQDILVSVVVSPFNSSTGNSKAVEEGFDKRVECLFHENTGALLRGITGQRK